jgi:hypothetical protein
VKVGIPYFKRLLYAEWDGNNLESEQAEAAGSWSHRCMV